MCVWGGGYVCGCGGWFMCGCGGWFMCVGVVVGLWV